MIQTNSKPVTFCWVLLPLNPTYIFKLISLLIGKLGKALAIAPIVAVVAPPVAVGALVS
ncbi:MULTISPECIES: hypothetical protein [unclassified Okeania]|uniref:hypothetical protein n=1 Tax=unclassified Okeania TaxID=2634635 RepID=UPI0013BC1E62|nr:MULTISPECIES: hypothetical protein [unclassified Okeania]NEP06567.1 hypothetical protein [Okeania sp. SIO4D6]NEP39458.1 hypothetical protein [Okeania sp. SIO2H7]NEP71544.1 hypothetical protein [Okeania sp. SIO2G5]NEP92515.1 hypothetical protein [Okeania sp. SIO2F5]NEQ92068.1 hypothetical protein [Okeania sp. SIO2G4]